MASRARALGGCGSTRFWFSAFLVALMPSSIGYQDIAAALELYRPAASPQFRQHLIASPFGTIEPATYSYGVRPIGTVMPQPPAIVLVNYDPGALDANDWSAVRPLGEQPAQMDYPTVNRRLKGDRLPLSNSAPPVIDPQSLPQLQPTESVPTTHELRTPALPPAPATVPLPPHAQVPAVAPHAAKGDADISNDIPAAGEIGAPGQASSSLAFADDDARDRSAQIYFGANMIDAPSGLKNWAPGDEPVRVTASIAGAADEIIGGKDESRVESPAQRLGLNGKARAKAEKCLADAVYFEARGEPLRGQAAVAQVVMNRVFSGYYPNNVCGVVYQNASHYLACQFTFACEHKDLSRIDEPDMWAQAKRIAKDTLDGKIWLPDIGHATHYHAYWVHPSWVHEMTRLDKLGVHTFYRPRAWGKGDDEPVWGTPPGAAKSGGKAGAAVKGPEADAAPAGAKSGATAKL
jgi:spore germination cell wall hydrolase CwlJ-like protein